MSADSGPDLQGAWANRDVHMLYDIDTGTISPLSRDLCLSTHQMSVTLKSDGITTCSEWCGAHTHKLYAALNRITTGTAKIKQTSGYIQ